MLKVFANLGGLLPDVNQERWRGLCEEVAKEQDPIKLIKLAKEINDLLDHRERRLDGDAPTDKPKASDA